MTDDPYTPLQRRILTLLEEKSVQHDHSGLKPPILSAEQDIVLLCRGNKITSFYTRDAILSALFDLEVLKILRHDTHDGTTYYGFHQSIVRMPGDHGTVYTIDPDLVCDRCGEVQSSVCLSGTCVR